MILEMLLVFLRVTFVEYFFDNFDKPNLVRPVVLAGNYFDNNTQKEA